MSETFKTGGGSCPSLGRMKFGYAIFYVDDVEKTVAFYERAFGLARKVVVGDEFGELDTGSTSLAFAARAHVETLLPIPVQSSGATHPPAPVEIALVTDDVARAFQTAVKAGAAAVAAPAPKPWGQTVAYVRDLNGFLVELCTPVG